ncbi:hypothetical protein TNCV_3615191 [Trichonephila clavipes]|nr:hypothetical protein TNCV_3615191 [Trichonephila clavipes]
MGSRTFLIGGKDGANGPREELMHVKGVETQSPFDDVMWKLGEKIPAQGRLGPSTNSSRYVLNCDVYKQSMNPSVAFRSNTRAIGSRHPVFEPRPSVDDIRVLQVIQIVTYTVVFNLRKN